MKSRTVAALAVALLVSVPAAAQQGARPEGSGTATGQAQGVPKPAQVPGPSAELTSPARGAPRVAQPGGTLPGQPAIQLQKVADGLIDPVNVVSAKDGTGRLFVVERVGRVRLVKNGQVQSEPFLDIADKTVSSFLEQGFYDIAFHPDFRTNGYVFVHFAEMMRNGDSMIVRYQVARDNPDKLDPNSAKVIMQIEQPYANHNGGEIEFGPDGYLYIGSGDGGWEGDPLNTGQDTSTLLGKILRIDVNVPDDRPYAVPTGNPFAQRTQLVQLFGIEENQFARINPLARPEIWAYGLRNPWKFNFDRETGDLYIADVGQNHWEEIDFQPANSRGGENYGWKHVMGTHCFPVQQQGCPMVGVPPIAQYGHAEGGCAVVGLGVYRGQEFQNLRGTYFAGDYCSGKVWGMKRDQSGAWAMAEVFDSDAQITGAGEDEKGEMYVTSCNCTYDNRPADQNPPGSLWRLVASGAPRQASGGAAPTSGATR